MNGLSTAVSAVEVQVIEVVPIDDPAKKVVVVPVGPEAVLSQDIAGNWSNERVQYFTHGCYTRASARFPRLMAPGLVPETRSRRLPRTLPKVKGAG
jgi:hypothetical protein